MTTLQAILKQFFKSLPTDVLNNRNFPGEALAKSICGHF